MKKLHILIAYVLGFFVFYFIMELFSIGSVIEGFNPLTQQNRNEVPHGIIV
jgi:hypothetical protein